MIAVCVTFFIVPGQAQTFLRLMHSQAADSLSREPDCHQFDVCTDGESEDRVFLYETYTDRAAFDAHLASDHFKSFDAAVQDLVATKHVAIYNTVTPGSE